MKLVARGASSAALIVGLAGGFHAAWAQAPQTVTTNQQAPQPGAVAQFEQVTPPEEQNQAADGERITIVGSILPGRAEDAPKPVEVFTRDELKEIGSPSVAEFIRDLSIASDSDIGGLESSGDGTGETTGYAPANLRGLGDTATLTLLNGRRLSTDNGTGADLNTIPSNALAAVEVLRDGASTTYGAGAVGGVINLVTRRDINAPEITVRHETYDKSAGEWAVEAATGWVGDAGNVLLTYSYDKSNELRYTERDFSSQPFDVNPTGYTLDNGSYTLISNALYNQFTGQAYPTNWWLPGNTQAAGSTTASTSQYRRIMDLTAAQCTNAGGAPIQELAPGARFTTSTLNSANARLNNGCALPLANVYSLVNEDEAHRVFAEVNLDVTDDMEVSVNMLYSTLNVIGANAPSEQVTSAATIPFGATTSQNSTVCGTGCGYVIPAYTPVFNAAGTSIVGSVQNPFVADFLSRTGTTGTFDLGDALYVGPGWRPILFGGNPLFEDGRVKDRSQRERFQIVGEVKGEFNTDGALSFLNGIHYNYSGQFNKQMSTIRDNLLLTSRLQNALLGYGGPSCTARDRVATPYNVVPATISTTTGAGAAASNQQRAEFNSSIGIQSDTAPGTNGCLWFNPFNSSWQTSSLTGANNSPANGGVYGGAGFENPDELIRWLFRERVYETIRESLIFDTQWSGEIPFFELPGGKIAWGAGLNWRQTEYRQLLQGGTADTAVGAQACAFPDPQFDLQGTSRQPTGEPAQYIGAAGCTNATGAWTSTGRYLSRFADEQTFAYLAQFDIPVLDNLNLQASWRREEFNNGRITGNIWSIAGKYDITDDLYVRASYGTNFRATDALNQRPGSVETSFRLAGAVWGRLANVGPQSYNIIATDLQPEDDRTLNIGVGYQNDDFFFGSRLRASIDFFEIGLYDQVVGGSAATLATPAIDAVFRKPDGSVTANATEFEQTLANCSAPAIIFFGFNTPDKTCQAGVTGSDVTEFYAFTDNGGGFITNGLDYSINWSIPVFNGRFSADLRATQTLVYKDKGVNIGGVQLEPAASQLGLTAGSGNNRSVDWRGTGTFRYSTDVHTVTLRGTFQSGQWVRGYLACLDPYYNPATNVPASALLGTLQSFGSQVSQVGGSASCGTGLTNAYLNPATGAAADDPANGAAQFSDFGVRPEDRIYWDINYIYSPPWMEGLELGASVENIFDEDPILGQTNRGYVAGNPRGRIYQLEVTKRF